MRERRDPREQSLGGYHNKGIGNITWDFMTRQAADRGLVIDPARRTLEVTIETLPSQHESFDRAWRDLSTKWNLIPEGVRTIGPTTTGPAGEPLRVAPK